MVVLGQIPSVKHALFLQELVGPGNSWYYGSESLSFSDVEKILEEDQVLVAYFRSQNLLSLYRVAHFDIRNSIFQGMYVHSFKSLCQYLIRHK